MTLARVTNRTLQEQRTSQDVPARWRVATETMTLDKTVVKGRVVSEVVQPVSIRIEHGDGDHTIVLGSVIAGPRHDPVEADYSFLDD